MRKSFVRAVVKMVAISASGLPSTYSICVFSFIPKVVRGEGTANRKCIDVYGSSLEVEWPRYKSE